MFLYKSLRNLTVYSFWIVIGIIHLYIYFQLKDSQDLQNFNGPSAIGFRNTIIFLLFFQLLRYISLKIQGRELVCPAKFSTIDMHDRREVTQLDGILFFVYFVCTL